MWFRKYLLFNIKVLKLSLASTPFGFFCPYILRRKQTFDIKSFINISSQQVFVKHLGVGVWETEA